MRQNSFIIIIVLFTSSVNPQSPLSNNFGIARNNCQKPIVEITVSPLVTKQLMRTLDVIWDVGTVWDEGDWIALYEQPPDIRIQPKYSVKVTEPKGIARTKVEEKRKFPESPNFQRTCLKFWAAYWKENSTEFVASSCLETNPTWMEDLEDEIRNLKLIDAFIPGTHDSGAFLLAYSPFNENRYQKYVYAQDESIMEQLIHGARYLDFRIGRYKNIYWLNHGIARVHPLEHVLSEIKDFLNNTEEIVIIDFHTFPVGFKDESDHEGFVKYLQDELGDLMASPHLGWTATLGQIWSQKKRLIVAYNNENVVRQHKRLLWPGVSQKWGNVRSLEELFIYFTNIFNRTFKNRRVLWSAMAELTPDTWGVISDKYKGLRHMADSVNYNVTSWFSGDWGAKCNVVAVDFLRSTGIVSAAVKWNKRRAAKTMCDK